MSAPGSGGMPCMNSMAAPANYPKSYSYKVVLDALKESKKENNNHSHINKSEKTAKQPEQEAQSPAVPTVVPTLASPPQPQPGDIVIRHLLADGGRLTKLKRDEETHYHLKCPDGRQVFLEKKPDCLSLLITDKRGQPIHVLACEL